jgi:hypothetical protein
VLTGAVRKCTQDAAANDHRVGQLEYRPVRDLHIPNRDSPRDVRALSPLGSAYFHLRASRLLLLKVRCTSQIELSSGSLERPFPDRSTER